MTSSEKLPVSTPIIVLSADPTAAPTIGWCVKEYMGSPIHLMVEGVPDVEHTIPATQDLLKGMEVACPSLWDGYFVCRVEFDDRGAPVLLTKGQKLMVVLHRGGDDRECWVTGGYINTLGLKKLSIDGV